MTLNRKGEFQSNETLTSSVDNSHAALYSPCAWFLPRFAQHNPNRSVPLDSTPRKTNCGVDLLPLRAWAVPVSTSLAVSRSDEPSQRLPNEFAFRPAPPTPARFPRTTSPAIMAAAHSATPAKRAKVADSRAFPPNTVRRKPRCAIVLADRTSFGAPIAFVVRSRYHCALLAGTSRQRSTLSVHGPTRSPIE